jgi:hypothetical protein
MVLNILSFVFAIVGIFFAGIPCGIAAVVLGIIGLATHRRLKGFGISGIIVGVIDIVIVAVYVTLVAMGILVA